jgi:hypothetical protein
MLLREGTDPKYGARHLKRAIERHLVFPLSNLVATSQIHIGDYIKIGIEDEELTFTVEKENSLVPIMLARFGDLGLKTASELDAVEIDIEPEIPEEDIPSESMQRARRSMKKAEDGLKKAKELQARLDEILHKKPQPDTKE